MTRSRTLPVFALVCLSAASVMLAQWQVNPRVERRVDNSLYGAGTAPPIKYSRNTSVAMDSEVRHAYWKSGMTPSEWKANQNALGARPAGGSMAYVSGKPAWTQVHNQGEKYGPAPQGQAAYLTGSVRHSNLPPSSNQIVTRPINTSSSFALPSSAVNSSFTSGAKQTGWSTKPTGAPSVPYALPANTTYKMPTMSGSIRHP